MRPRGAMVASLFLTLFLAGGGAAQAEILAMMNYETKTPDSLKALKLGGEQERREGIAIFDVDPQSPAFGRMLMDIPMPASQIVHHIFYDRTMTKAYVTSLGQPSLQVLDLTQFPYRLRTVATEGCVMAEDVIFDESNEHWFLTCMQSGHVFKGRVGDDTLVAVSEVTDTYPHGIAVDSAINRLITTSTVSGDLQDARESVTILDATTLMVLGSKRLSLKPEGSGEAPVEVLFVPGASPPVAYVTNMFGGTLWTLTWNEGSQDFDAAQVFDFATVGAGVPLELYFTPDGSRLFVTTGSPGELHVFDLAADRGLPSLVASYATGEGAHHVGFTKDWRYAFVQNALLNLPGLSDGAVTVVDLQKGEVVASMDSLKNAGFNPNSLVLLPEWNEAAGH